MSWNSSLYTNSGADMVAELLGGRTLTISKATGGAGAASTADEQKAQTTVLEEKQTFKILALEDATDSSGEVIGKRIKIQITNETLTEGYVLHQVGIFAKLDDATDETLMIVMQDDRGIEIPSHADNADFEIELFAIMTVSNVANLKVEIDPNALATIEQLDTVKTTLEAKITTVQSNVDTVNTDLSGKITTVQNNVDTVKQTYLPLSGGTMTGDVTFNNCYLRIAQNGEFKSYFSPADGNFHGNVNGNVNGSADSLAATTFTGNDDDNTGYRLIAQVSIKEWTNHRCVMLVRSRHQGTGMVTITIGNNSAEITRNNTYAEIKYWGPESSGTAITDDAYQVYVSADGKTCYLFWKYDDGSLTYAYVISSDFTLSNGTWMSSIGSEYGTLIASTKINVGSKIASLGHADAPTSGGVTSGMTVSDFHNNSNTPCVYANVINISGDEDGCSQLALGWSGGDEGIEHLYYRNKRDLCDTWSKWQTVAFTSDISAAMTSAISTVDELSDMVVEQEYQLTLLENGVTE